jgi:hypothetical protein
MQAHAVLQVHLWSTVVMAYQVCWGASPIKSNASTCSFACAFVEHNGHWLTKFVEVRHPSDQMQARAVLQAHSWSTVFMAYQVCWSASPIRSNAGTCSFAGAFMEHSCYGIPSLLRCVTHQIKCRHVQFCRCISEHSCYWHTNLFEVRHLLN